MKRIEYVPYLPALCPGSFRFMIILFSLVFVLAVQCGGGFGTDSKNAEDLGPSLFTPDTSEHAY